MSGGQRIEDWLAREENNVRFVFLGNQATLLPSAQRFSLDSPSSPFPVSIRRPHPANRRGCTSSSKREHQGLGRLGERPSPCLDINVRSLYYLFLDSPSAFSLFLPLPPSLSLYYFLITVIRTISPNKSLKKTRARSSDRVEVCFRCKRRRGFMIEFIINCKLRDA